MWIGGGWTTIDFVFEVSRDGVIYNSFGAIAHTVQK